MGHLTKQEPNLTSFVDHLCYFCLVLVCFHARLFVDALWSPAGKGLTSWLSFVMSNCDAVTFPLVSWVRCGAELYRFLTLFLTFTPFTTTRCCLKNRKESTNFKVVPPIPYLNRLLLTPHEGVYRRPSQNPI